MLKLLCIIILILVCANIVFISLFINCKNKDKFCSADNLNGKCCGTCQGMGTKVFPDRKKLSQLYNSGCLTENTPRVVHSCDHSKKKQEITELDILDKYYNQQYFEDGKPKGGILITMIDTPTLCPNYIYSGTKKSPCLTDISECFLDSILDITNITELLEKLRKSASTSCYAVDTTYFRTDLPNYVFGPIDTDINIGLILDLQKLWDYVACMFSIDSGSVSRYNNCCNNSDDCIPDIDSSLWKGKGEKGWNMYLNSKDSNGLAMAGCGKSGNDGLCHTGLKDNAADWIIHENDKAREHVKNVSEHLNKENIINNWVFGKGNAPFSKYQWELWIEQVKIVYGMAETTKFIEQGVGSNIGKDPFRENEVDIIVPNNTRNKNDSCNVTEEFKNVWIDSIMGVVTNAKTNCSNNPSFKNIKTFGCDGDNCCCSEHFSKKLTKYLAEQFSKKYHKINGYTMDTLNISNFNWKNGINSELNLQKI